MALCGVLQSNGSKGSQRSLYAAIRDYCEHSAFLNGIDENSCTAATTSIRAYEQLIELVERLHSSERTADHWLYFRIAAEPSMRKHIVARIVAPIVDKASIADSLYGWWWLNKTDPIGEAIRIRFYCTPTVAPDFGDVLHAMLQKGGLDVARLHYEPEKHLFGGEMGMQLAHSQFMDESRFLVKWMEANQTNNTYNAIPLGLSIAFVFHLLRSCGLDVFEQLDVFSKVCDRRPSKATVMDSGQLSRVIHRAFTSPLSSFYALFPDRSSADIEAYGEKLSGLGRSLCSLHYKGELHCGLRAFLVTVILFHWNRMELSSASQNALAHAIKRMLEADLGYRT